MDIFGEQCLVYSSHVFLPYGMIMSLVWCLLLQQPLKISLYSKDFCNGIIFTSGNKGNIPSREDYEAGLLASILKIFVYLCAGTLGCDAIFLSGQQTRGLLHSTQTAVGRRKGSCSEQWAPDASCVTGKEMSGFLTRSCTSLLESESEFQHNITLSNFGKLTTTVI